MEIDKIGWRTKIKAERTGRVYNGYRLDEGKIEM